MPAPPQDDALMDRFERNARRFKARDAIVTVFVCLIALIVIQGGAVKKAGNQQTKGVSKSVTLAVGKPTGWIAGKLPFHHVAYKLTSGLSPDAKLSSKGGFNQTAATGAAGQVPIVTTDAFVPEQIGAPAAPKKVLHKILVTGDSLSTPLDLEMANALSGKGVKVIRDPHLGAGISKTDLVDFGKLSVTQTEKDSPDAVVVFMGANEGYPMKDPATKKDVDCCSPQWATIYANRARQMMNTYRRNGAAHVYWLTVMTSGKANRLKLFSVVNAAIKVAAQPWADQVSIVDTIPIFTPGNKFRASMQVHGKDTIVREPDEIHLNRQGAQLLAEILTKQVIPQKFNLP